MLTTTHPSKDQIIALLYAWISQRPGLEFGNYGDITSYRAEVRSIGKDLQHARILLGAVERSGITAEQLMAAFPRAFSGRLTLEAHPNKPGAWRLSYCAGQYWPTEYRRAACAVLASALWDYKREHCMPAPSGKVTVSHGVGAFAHESEHDSIEGKSPGDWLRHSFRREFGRGIASRWFD